MADHLTNPLGEQQLFAKSFRSERLPDQMATEPPPKQLKYGAYFPARYNRLDIELWCFRTGRTREKGGLGKAEHFWNIISLLYGKNNPVGNKSKFFIRNPWSEDIITALCENRYVGVGGCAGSTKSETLALWVLVNFLCNPRHTLCVVMSTSIKEAKRRIWGSLVDFIRAIPAPGLPLQVIDSTGTIRYRFQSDTDKLSDRSTIALVAAERKQERDAVGKLIGMHNALVVVVADELSELTPAILEYALPGGNLTSNPDYQFVGLSNPVSYYDPFGVLWKPKAGWMSVNVEDSFWETEFGVAIHFDGTKSPNIAAGKTLFPFLPTAQKIEEAKRAEGGENSLRFWRMVRGFFAPMGQEDLIYAEQDIVKYKGDEPAIWGDQPLQRCAALDPGFTNGGDRSIVYLGTLGLSKDRVMTLNYDRFVELVEDVTSPEERSYQIARKFMELCVANGIPPRNAAVDATGAGGPFCDIVSTVWSREILRVKFGGKASEQPVSLTDPAKGFERYYDRVTEIWYSGVELLRQGQLKGIAPQMAHEMTARKYGTTGADKRIYAESKVDMKLRTKKSPDIADAGFILLALCRERLGFGARYTSDQQKLRKATPGAWRNLRARVGAVRFGALPVNVPR